MIKAVLALMLIVAICALIRLHNRPVRRTRVEVIKLLEQAMVTGGDDSWDDLVSVRIADPELESVRRKCQALELAPKDVFDHTLLNLIEELRKPNSEERT